MKCKMYMVAKKFFNPLVFMIATFSLTEKQHVRNAGLFYIIATFISLKCFKELFVKISLTQRLKERIFSCYDFLNDFNIIFLSFQIDKLA